MLSEAARVAAVLLDSSLKIVFVIFTVLNPAKMFLDLSMALLFWKFEFSIVTRAYCSEMVLRLAAFFANEQAEILEYSS